jgi:hypothetical protein
MKIRKQIFRSGNSFVIYLDKSIMDSYNLKEGDFIELSDMIKYKKLPKSKNMSKEIKEYLNSK